TPAGLVAAGHHRQGRQAGNGHVACILHRAERAIAMLVPGEVREPLVDRLLSGGGDHAFGRAAVRKISPVVGPQTARGHSEPNKTESTINQECEPALHGQYSFAAEIKNLPGSSRTRSRDEP